MHGNSGQAAEPVRPLCHVLGQHVIGPAHHVGRLLRVRHGLQGRRIQRQQHTLDAMLVHLLDTLVLNIEQAAPQHPPGLGTHEFL